MIKYGITHINASQFRDKGPWHVHDSEMDTVIEFAMQSGPYGDDGFTEYSLDELCDNRSDWFDEETHHMSRDEFFQWFFDTEVHNCRTIEELMASSSIYYAYHGCRSEYFADGAEILWSTIVDILDGDYSVIRFEVDDDEEVEDDDE